MGGGEMSRMNVSFHTYFDPDDVSIEVTDHGGLSPAREPLVRIKAERVGDLDWFATREQLSRLHEEVGKFLSWEKDDVSR